jgi:hypothetical protein
MNSFEILQEAYKRITKNSKQIIFREKIKSEDLIYSDWEESRHAIDKYESAHILINKKILISYGKKEKIICRGGESLDFNSLEHIIIMELNPSSENYENDFKSFLNGCIEYNDAKLIFASKNEINFSYKLSDYILNNSKSVTANKDSINIMHKKDFMGNRVKIKIKNNNDENVIKTLIKLIKKYIKINNF